MNLLHLKYAAEVAREGSFSKAAQKLFTGQPNLSRAITELEDSLGIKIFERTPKGVTPTSDGEEFLEYAKRILVSVNEVEQIYSAGKRKKTVFSISVPRASYISSAFAKFAAKLTEADNIEIFYNETNARSIVGNIINSDYKLGILRYRTSYEEAFRELIREKDLSSEVICDFSYSVVVSKDSPLTKKDKISLTELSGYTEIVHADPHIPSLAASEFRKNEFDVKVNGRVFVFERASQLELLSESCNTFMWASPMPQKTLDRFSLVQLKCDNADNQYRDLLIFKNGYKLTDTDKMFIDELVSVKRSIGL